MGQERTVPELYLMVADSWSVRPFDRTSLVAHPREFLHLPIADVPISVFVKVHTLSTSFQDFVAKLVTRRTGVPDPVFEVVPLGPASGLRIEWTDGILDMESVFVDLKRNMVLEITFSMEPLRTSDLWHHHRHIRDELCRFVDIPSLIESLSP